MKKLLSIIAFLIFIFIFSSILYGIIRTERNALGCDNADKEKDISNHQKIEKTVYEITAVDGHYTEEGIAHYGKGGMYSYNYTIVWIKDDNGQPIRTKIDNRNGDQIITQYLNEGYTKPCVVKIIASNDSQYLDSFTDLTPEDYNFTRYIIYLPNPNIVPNENIDNDILYIPSDNELGLPTIAESKAHTSKFYTYFKNFGIIFVGMFSMMFAFITISAIKRNLDK